MGTISSNLLPNSTGLDLGSPSQRFDAFLKDADITGTIPSLTVDTLEVETLNNLVFADNYASFAAALAVATGQTLIVTTPMAISGNTSIPSTVDLRITQGGLLTVASGRTLTIDGSFEAGVYQVFAGAGTVQFTANSVVRPEWWGAVADGTTGAGPVTGTDNLAAFNSALAALPIMNYYDQGTQLLTPSGNLARTGKFLLSSGRYVVSDTLYWSPWVVYESSGYNQSTITLKDGVAASGSEKWVIVVQAVDTGGSTASPNTTYGGQFKNLSVDGQGGKYYGTNAKSSGVQFNGSQGASLGNVEIANCGLRGLWVANNGSNTSSINGENIIEVIGIVTGPGVQLDVGATHISTIRSEDVNSSGAALDADGDPNPALLIGSASSNGCNDTNITFYGSEKSYLPLKIWSGNAINIGTMSLGIGVGGSAPDGVIISHGANAVSFGPIFTFSAINLFTNFINDRVNTVTIPGNSVTFPSIPGYITPGNSSTPLRIIKARIDSLTVGTLAATSTVDLTAQTAAVTTTSLPNGPFNAGQYRLSWNAKVTTADGVSSTLGALTIAYVDPDNVTQTITAAAQIAAGTIATTSTGNTTTTVLLGVPMLLNVKAATNVTYAMAYASNTPAAMNYNLHIKLEALG